MDLFMRSSICVLKCTKRMFRSVGVQLANQSQEKLEKPILYNNVFEYIINSNLIVKEKLKTNKSMEQKEWALLRRDLLHNFKLTETNVDAKIYDICIHYNRYNEAISYFKFLESNNYKLNLNIIGSYLRIYYLLNRPISATEEEEIIRVYDNVQKQYPLLDYKTCSDCILALSLTAKWKESLKLLDMMQMTSLPGNKVISAIICAAFQNKDDKLGWKLMTNSIKNGPLEHIVYIQYLNFCLTEFESEKIKTEVEKIFMFWREYSIKSTELVVKKYADLYEKFGYTVSYTSVSAGGLCTSCKESLSKTSLNKEEFNVLATSTLKNLIVGENIFYSTSPQELKRYLLFVKTMKSYDVVIDGLNVAYSRRTKSQCGSMERVLEVVNYFYKKKKKVLVVGRAHMNWWSKEIMRTLQERADVFLIKNLSEDDPFLLHLTMISGSETYFVSRDLMRQHKHRLTDTKLKNLFVRWQISRQYKYIHNKDKLILLPPIPFDTSVQKSNKGWHIPYSTSEELVTPQIHDYQTPTNWVCLKKN